MLQRQQPPNLHSSTAAKVALTCAVLNNRGTEGVHSLQSGTVPQCNMLGVHPALHRHVVCIISAVSATCMTRGISGIAKTSICVASALCQPLQLTCTEAAVSAASSAACVQHQNQTLLLPVPQPAAAIAFHHQRSSPQQPPQRHSAKHSIRYTDAIDFQKKPGAVPRTWQCCMLLLCFITSIAVDDSHNGAILRSIAFHKQVQLTVNRWAVTR
jgi:hypothetical protein